MDAGARPARGAGKLAGVKFSISVHSGFHAPADALDQLWQRLGAGHDDTRFSKGFSDIRATWGADVPVSMERDEREQLGRLAVLEILEAACARAPRAEPRLVRGQPPPLGRRPARRVEALAGDARPAGATSPSSMLRASAFFSCRRPPLGARAGGVGNRVATPAAQDDRAADCDRRPDHGPAT